MAFGGFGSNTNTFGSSNTAFGSTNNTFGNNTANASPFGATANNNTNVFGGNTTNAFGSTQQNSTFGGFGAQQQSASPFGGQTNTATNSFGNTNTGLFGNTGGTTTGFGGTTNNAFGSTPTTGVGTNLNPNQDYELPQAQCPTDGISCLEWSPVSNLIAVGSWDNTVRCYQVNGGNMQAVSVEPKAYIQHQAPVLDISFKNDGTGCFSAGCDNVVKWWQFSANPGLQQAQDVGRHDAPIKCVEWIKEMNVLATAGWDNTLRFWDMRQPTAVCTVQLMGKASAMDVRHPVMVVCSGSQDRAIQIFDLGRFAPNMTASSTLSHTNAPLKKQYRCVSIFPDKSGYAIGSIEGRVAIQYFEPNTSNNFAFKCHRDKDNKIIYPVNAISFHPTQFTFSTAGADGKWNFWDKDSKQRLKASEGVVLNNRPLPIVSTGFNYTGELFAYALSYDWSLGAQPHNPQQTRNYMLIHTTREADVKPRRSTMRNRRL